MQMDGYIRQSRSPKSGEGISPAQQRDRIEAWAKARNVEIVAWHQDIDQSGSKLVRPGLDAMLARIESGQTGGVVVAKLDRLSRAGLIDTLKIIERIHGAGAVLASDDFGLDPTTKEGEFMLGIILGLARLEWRRAAEDWEDAKERAISRGVTLTAAPLGYVKGPGGVLEADPQMAPLITRAFELAAEHGVKAAQLYLQEADEGAPRNRWALPSVRRMLARRVYLGEVDWNGKRAEGAHDPLTDLATWTRAQSAPVGRGPAGRYPLSNVVLCATCGGGMVGSTTRHGKRKYRCSTGGGRQAKPGECANRAAIDADPLEEFLFKFALIELEALEADPTWTPVTAGGGSAEAELRALESAKLRRDEFAAADLDVSPAAWAARMAALDDAVAAAEEAYRSALASAAPAKVLIPSEVLRERGPEGLVEVLEGLGHEIRVRPGRGEPAQRVVVLQSPSS